MRLCGARDTFSGSHLACTFIPARGLQQFPQEPSLREQGQPASGMGCLQAKIGPGPSVEYFCAVLIAANVLEHGALFLHKCDSFLPTTDSFYTSDIGSRCDNAGTPCSRALLQSQCMQRQKRSGAHGREMVSGADCLWPLFKALIAQLVANTRCEPDVMNWVAPECGTVNSVPASSRSAGLQRWLISGKRCLAIAQDVFGGRHCRRGGTDSHGSRGQVEATVPSAGVLCG